MDVRQKSSGKFQATPLKQLYHKIKGDQNNDIDWTETHRMFHRDMSRIQCPKKREISAILVSL